MNDPSNVIAKVRKSLGRSVTVVPPAPPVLHEPLVRLVLSDIGLPKLFEKKAAEAKMDVTALRVDDIHAAVVDYLRSKNVKSIALPQSDFLDRLAVPEALREAGFNVRLWTQMTLDDVYDVDASVTDVWRVVAETGSLVMRASAEHGRALSLIPPLHVAIVEPKNCVGDLFDLFSLLTTQGAGSATHIITGPSKTADIEMNLVVGVHGPGVVKIFLLN
jgi:L-lactate dehydrogenase complex protein LldG